MPPTTYERATAGPAYPAAASPVRTKSPVPMITPIPNRVRSRGPNALRSWNSGSSVSRMDCSTDFVRMIPMSRPFQVPYTILTPTIRAILQVSTFLCCTEQLAQGPCGRWMYYAKKILWTPTRDPGRFVVSGCPTRVRPCLPSAVRRFSGDFGAVVGLDDGAEGCPLLRGAQDADRVAGFERQVSPWVRDHLVSPHYGQDGRPGLASHAKISYGVTQKVAPSVTLGLLFPGDLYLGQPYPLYLDRLGSLPQPR